MLSWWSSPRVFELFFDLPLVGPPNSFFLFPSFLTPPSLSVFLPFQTFSNHVRRGPAPSFLQQVPPPLPARAPERFRVVAESFFSLDSLSRLAYDEPTFQTKGDGALASTLSSASPLDVPPRPLHRPAFFPPSLPSLRIILCLCVFSFPKGRCPELIVVAYGIVWFVYCSFCKPNAFLHFVLLPLFLFLFFFLSPLFLERVQDDVFHIKRVFFFPEAGLHTPAITRMAYPLPFLLLLPLPSDISFSRQRVGPVLVLFPPSVMAMEWGMLEKKLDGLEKGW